VDIVGIVYLNQNKMNTKIDYTDLHTIYPEDALNSETYEIKRVVLSEEQVRMEQIRSAMGGNYWTTTGLKADFPYVKLVKKGEGVMMSDTPMERNTNRHFIKNANGDVLIFGLGLGLVILPLLKKEVVKSILVVELYQDLIDVVQPILKNHDTENKLSIIQGDCFEIHKSFPKEQKFDSIYGDIWIEICTDNYEEMKTLTKNWKNRVNRNNPLSFIDHWMKDYLKGEIAKEKRQSYRYW
jgi:hypothetical protein